MAIFPPNISKYLLRIFPLNISLNNIPLNIFPLNIFLLNIFPLNIIHLNIVPREWAKTLFLSTSSEVQRM